MKRLYNYAEAVDYIGAKKSFFDAHIKPRVIWTRAGTCSIAEKVDLDRAWDEYCAELAAGRIEKAEHPWQNEPQASTKTTTATGRSTRYPAAVDFAKASERILAKRKRGSSSNSPS